VCKSAMLILHGVVFLPQYEGADKSEMASRSLLAESITLVTLSFCMPPPDGQQTDDHKLMAIALWEKCIWLRCDLNL